MVIYVFNLNVTSWKNLKNVFHLFGIITDICTEFYCNTQY